MRNISKINKALFSLGSNLGSRKKNLKSCIASINNCKNIKVVGISSLYESSPMYNSNQQDFIKQEIDKDETFSDCSSVKSELTNNTTQQNMN